MIEPQSRDQLAKLRDAFKASIEAAIEVSHQMPDSTSGNVARALALAAFSGPFDAHRLVQFAPEAEQPELVSKLLEVSDGLTVKGRRRRLLEITTRRRILAALLKRPDQLEQLLGILPAAREDAQGRALRKLLCGWRPSLRKLKFEQLSPLSAALGWLQGLAPSQGIDPYKSTPWPEIGDVQREQAQRARRAEIRSLLPNGIVGRSADLRKLCEFVDAPDSAGDIMIISGAGGIGKSTLVAALSAALAARKKPVPVLNFDFDRPSIDLAGPGLSLDLTRQLARALPQSVDRLAEARSLIREEFGRRGGYSDYKESAEVLSVSTIGEANLVMRQEIMGTAFTEQPVLVLLDSFEVAAARGHSAVSALRNWLAALTRDVGIRHLRTLVVGRAAESVAALLGVKESAIYRLGPLSNPEAIRLLLNSGLDGKRAREAANSLGGNPLILRLASRYLVEHPEDSGKMGLRNKGVNEALSQGLLYRRILNRVGHGDDDPLRKLAYPGLALRIVTPKILSDVLAPIMLNAAYHDEENNTALFDRLAQQIWLVDRESERLVRHRRDLREITLKLLNNDPDLGALVNELHAKAIEYYSNAEDPDLPDNRAQLELVYHRLMLLPHGKDLAPRDRNLVQSALAGEFDELPPHAAALARLHSGKITTSDDLKILPKVYQHRATADIAWDAIDTGHPEDALALYGGEHPIPVWFLTAIHDTAQWQCHSKYLARARTDDASSELTLERRENSDEARAVISFLHLWRREFHKIPSPDKALPIHHSYKNGSPKLRAAAAWGITALLERKLHHPGWQAIREMLEPKYKIKKKDALTVKAEARLWLLLWAAEQLEPNDQIPVLAESLAITPTLSHKLNILWLRTSKTSKKPNLISKPNLPPSVALLTGTMARDIEYAFKDRLRRIDLESVGLCPRDFLPGLMTELQPASRLALRSFIAEKNNLYIFAHNLMASPYGDFEKVIPRDLNYRQWLKAASEGDGLRAILPLLDWYGRLGKLSEVFHQAANLSAGSTATTLHNLSSAWYLLESACTK